MPARHVGENDDGKHASKRGKKDVDSKERRRRGKESRLYGKREEKFTARVRETPVPGQSIKNVSRAEIIKVRISGGGVRAMRDEERRCMTRGSGRVLIESGWKARGELWERRVDGGCLKYSPVRLRGSRWEIFIDSHP